MKGGNKGINLNLDCLKYKFYLTVLRKRYSVVKNKKDFLDAYGII